MYSFDNKELSDLVIVSIGLNKIIEDFKNIRNEEELINATYDIRGEYFTLKEICGRSLGRVYSVQDIQEMYKKVERRCKKITGKNIRDFFRE